MTKFLILLALIGQASADSPIKVISYKDAQISISEMTSSEYSGVLIQLKDSLDSELIDGLNDLQYQGAFWNLQKFSVGLGTTGEMGIGPYKLGLALKQRLVYSR